MLEPMIPYVSLQLFAEGGEGGAADGAAAPNAAAADTPQTNGADPAPESDRTPESTPPDPRLDFAAAQVQQWQQQAEQARRFYPGLDLEAESRNPRFCQLLRSGVDVESAYLVVHRHEILPAAMRHAARVAEQRLSSAIAAGSARPAENGLSGQSPAVTRQDVSRLSRQQREEIRKRAARGERVTF